MKKSNFVLVCCIIISLLGITELSAKSIGPSSIAPTSLSKGTIFVAPSGRGTTCLVASPCDIWTAISKAVAGSVIFLRGGTYPVSRSINFSKKGTATAPIIFENYPGETAIFDGSQHAKGANINFLVNGNFIRLRGIEVRNMPRDGIYISGTDNIMDGVHVHHNALTGIVNSLNYVYPYGATHSRNTIRNCTVHHNSGVGYGSLGNGGDSDGIAISSGTDNRVENCLVYSNSDDGIDAWRSTNTYIGYNIVHSNGLGDGDGNGIKSGGVYPSSNTLVEHNLVHSNRTVGINFNQGRKARYINNTTWKNGYEGYYLGYDTIAMNNIAGDSREKVGSGSETNNSWQRSSNVAFISTSTTSSGFLVPTSGGGFDDIGAHVGVTNAAPSALPDVVVTQVSYANGIFKSTIKNQGTAATPAGKSVGVGYLVDGRGRAWGDYTESLAVGQSIVISSRSGAYIIPSGTHTIAAHVDDVNRFAESDETNNRLSLQITVP